MFINISTKKFVFFKTKHFVHKYLSMKLGNNLSALKIVPGLSDSNYSI